MSLKNVFSIVAGVIITLQLCDSNGNESKMNYSNDAMDQQPSDVSSDVTEIANSSDSTTVTSTFRADIKITNQKYSENTSGEYKHEVSFSNGNWRAEHGEYEDHDGVIVFVIRGVFQYHTKEGKFVTKLYIVDEFGYHIVAPPSNLYTPDKDGVNEFRPGTATGPECDGKEIYCIDLKLLNIMTG